MNLTLAIAGIALLFLMLIVGRLFRRHRGDLESYLRDAERQAAARIKRMQDETSRFSAHEAMAPVEAGVRELLELHNFPRTITLSRNEETLCISSPHSQCRVVWVLRHATLSGNYPGHARSFTPRSIHGNGHWELALNNDPPEPCADLSMLMGRLSAVLRGMAKQDMLENKP